MSGEIADARPPVAAPAQPATADTVPPSRGRAFAEVALVLLITFGGSTLSAITDLLRGIFGLPIPPSSALAPFPADWANLAFDAAYWLLHLAPAALALFLLLQAGAQPRDLGLWRPRWRDLFGALGLLLASLLVAGLQLLFMRVTQNQGVFHGTALRGSTLWDDLLRSLNAGVLEECVVLGYVVTRLERAGVSTTSAAIFSLAVRTSYHLYYGTAVVGPFLGGLVFTLFFVRFRRLLPVIGAHVLYDSLVSAARHV